MRRLILTLALLLGTAVAASADSLSTTTCPGAGCLIRQVPANANYIGIQVDGTYTGTLAFKYSINGTTYNSLSVYPDGAGTAATGTTSTGIWRGAFGGVQYVEVVFSAYTSGTAVVDIRFDNVVLTGGVGNTTNITPGGANGDLEYNNAGVMAGITASDWDGTTLTLPSSVIARIKAAGTSPTVADTSANSCGTGTETISGKDNAGKVTVIGSAGTSCTVTFGGGTFTNAPSCTASNETTAQLARATSTATTVVLAGTFAQNDVIAYVCIGN